MSFSFRVRAPLTALAALTLLALAPACGDKKQDAPAAAQQPAGNAGMFSDMSKPKLPGPPPDEDSAVAAQRPSGAPSLSAPILDPATEAKCKGLREQEKALRDQAQKLQEEKVAPVAAEVEQANDAFEACQEDFACVNNVETYQAKSARAQAAQTRLDAAEAEVAVIEGQLHTISSQISADCGE